MPVGLLLPTSENNAQQLWEHDHALLDVGLMLGVTCGLEQSQYTLLHFSILSWTGVEGDCFGVQDYVPRDAEKKLPVLAVSEDVYEALEASASKQGKSVAHLASESLRGLLL